MIKYVGTAISIILALIAFLMFLAGIYAAYKYSENLLPTVKALKLQAKFNFFSIASFSLSFFIFWMSNNGFSWDAFWFSLGLLIILSISVYTNYIISVKTATFLKSRNVSLPPLKGHRLAQHFFRKSSLKKDLNGDKED